MIDRIIPQRYWAWPEHVIRRVSSNEVRSLSTLHPWLAPGELLDSVPRNLV